jgi:hypothetical protein
VFKISNLVLRGEAIVTDLCSSLEGQRQLESERVIDRQRRPVKREEIMLVTTMEQRYVSEPIETKYLTF